MHIGLQYFLLSQSKSFLYIHAGFQQIIPLADCRLPNLATFMPCYTIFISIMWAGPHLRFRPHCVLHLWLVMDLSASRPVIVRLSSHLRSICRHFRLMRNWRHALFTFAFHLPSLPFNAELTSYVACGTAFRWTLCSSSVRTIGICVPSFVISGQYGTDVTCCFQYGLSMYAVRPPHSDHD